MKRTNVVWLSSQLSIILSFLSLSILYFRSMLPGLGFHDVGELQGVVPLLQIAHPTGFPSYMLVSFLLNLVLLGSDKAWNVNFLSLLYTIGGIFVFYKAIQLVIKDRAISLLSSIFIGLSVPIWNYAGMADTHTFGRLMLALIIYYAFSLKEKFQVMRFRLLFLLIGLSLGGHLFILYALPFIFVFIFFVLKDLKREMSHSVLLYIEAGVCFFVGLATYLFLPIRSLIGVQLLNYSLASWSGFYRHVSGSDFQGLMFQGGVVTTLHNVLVGFGNLYYWLGFCGSSLVVLGIFHGLKAYRLYSVILLLICLSFTMFAANYPTSDSSRYYGWVLLVSSAFVSFGMLFLIRLLKHSYLRYFGIFALLLLCFYSAISHFSQVDKHKNVTARVYADTVMNSVEPNAVILSWWHYMTPLRFEQMVEHKRPDVLILTKGPGEWLEYADYYSSTRSVYVVQLEDSLDERYESVPVGPVYQLILKKQ